MISVMSKEINVLSIKFKEDKNLNTCIICPMFQQHWTNYKNQLVHQ